jgi:hypothetical protein
MYMYLCNTKTLESAEERTKEYFLSAPLDKLKNQNK